MAFDIFDTHQLLQLIDQTVAAPSFLRDRYFPTNAATDVFTTSDVLTEIKDGDNAVAPFVFPGSHGIDLARGGFAVNRYTPPEIRLNRTLTVDELAKRGFGEALYSTLTPAQRQGAVTVEDLKALRAAITRRIELMCAQTMLDNAVTVKEVADDGSSRSSTIAYYSGSNNATYAAGAYWSTAATDIIGHLSAAALMLAKRGLPAADLVVNSTVANYLVNNNGIYKLLDAQHHNLVEFNPEELPKDAALIGRINIRGRNINIIAYDRTYLNDSGNDVPFIPNTKAVLTAPGAGRTVFGAVTQIDGGAQAFATYAAEFVPKVVASDYGNKRIVSLASRPLTMPNNVDPFICITGVAAS